MRTELIIQFDGESEALREHRLSVSDFGKPLLLLLSALRRTASGMGRTIEEGDSYGSRGGRFSRAADALDLQISQVRGGCVQLNLECVHRTEQNATAEMWFAQQAIGRLLDDIKGEARGELRNGNVRKYLASMPPYVTRQKYSAISDGEVFSQVTLGDVHIAEVPSLPARIQVVEGVLAGVVMEPGKESVSVRSMTPSASTRVTAVATDVLVERALELRHGAVRATILDGQKPRLLRIDELGADVAGSPDARLAFIQSHWAEALRELAK